MLLLNNDDPSTLIKRRGGELTTELFLAALVLRRASLHLVSQGTFLNGEIQNGSCVCVCSGACAPWLETDWAFLLNLGEMQPLCLQRSFWPRRQSSPVQGL